MVRNAIRLMEILSFLYMVAAAYNVKLKYNIYAVVFVISELFLLSGINDYGFSSYLLGFSYLIMFLYCLLNYRLGIKKSMLNCILASVGVSLIQMLCYFAITFIDFMNAKYTMSVIQREIVVSIVYFVFILVFSNKLRLKEISDFFMKRNKLLYMVEVFILLVLGSQIWWIKKDNVIDGKAIFFTIYFAILLILLIWEWQKTRNESEKRKIQLELNQVYFDAYEELIQSIREKQHDFKNHLNAIEGMIYSIDNYKELITEQKKYLQNITGDVELTRLLTLVENPLIAGFLNCKISKAKKLGIETKYNCILPKCEMKLPEFQIVEMMGILLDNAIEEMDNENVIDKILIIKLKTDDSVMKFSVSNTYSSNLNIDVSKIFEQGYSSKGADRGIGLAKLKRMVNENKGEVYTVQENLENLMMINVGFEISI